MFYAKKKKIEIRKLRLEFLVDLDQEMRWRGVPTYFKINKQLLQPLLGPGRRILFRPMPVVHIGRIGSLLNNPAWITLSPLGHVTEVLLLLRCLLY